MFKVTLPYCKKEFVIPIITFRDIFNLSRLYYDNNLDGVAEYLDNTFNIKGLSIVDKLFVIIKARQHYINDTISLNIGDRSVSVQVSLFLDPINDINCKNTIIDLGNNQQIELDIPYRFITDNSILPIYDNIIKTITIGDNTIDLTKQDPQLIQQLLELLPPLAINHLTNFIRDKSHIVEIFHNKQDDPISINFITSQPFGFVKIMLGEYDLGSCRDILFFLSKRMNSETVLNSPINDISFYIAQYQAELKENPSSNTGLPI